MVIYHARKSKITLNKQKQVAVYPVPLSGPSRPSLTKSSSHTF